MGRRILHLADVRFDGYTLLAAPLWAFGGKADTREVIEAINRRKRERWEAAVAEANELREKLNAGDAEVSARASFSARLGLNITEPPPPPHLYSRATFKREPWWSKVRSCRRCGQEFERMSGPARYCSDTCYAKRRRAARPSRATAHPARACARCGERFIPARTDARVLFGGLSRRGASSAR